MTLQKTKNILWMSLMLISAGFASCSKDDDNSNNNTPSCTDGILNQDEIRVDCGGSCSPCSTPAITQKFYVQAKIDGNWTTVEQAEVGHNINPPFMQVMVSQNGTVFSFDVQTNATKSIIEGLDGDTVQLKLGALPLINFGSIISGVNRNVASAEQIQHTGSAVSFMYFSQVKADGEYYGHPSYHAKGTFQCNMDRSQIGASDPISLTEGVFSIRLVAYE